MFSKRIHADIEPRLVCKFREIWLTGNRQTRALFTGQKTKFQITLPLSLLRGSRPKSVSCQLQTMYSEYPKFHPNPFTFGGVIQVDCAPFTITLSYRSDRIEWSQFCTVPHIPYWLSLLTNDSEAHCRMPWKKRKLQCQYGSICPMI